MGGIMTLQEKVKSLKAQRANLLGRIKSETRKLEAQFRKDTAAGKQDLTAQIKSYTGRYYAKVGPLLKKEKEYQAAIELLG